MVAIKNAVVAAGLASGAVAHSHGNIYTNCVTPGEIALTFDDGPHIYSQQIVDALTAAGHRVTFFQNGKPPNTQLYK
jgi:peptidoglycan/xylan/chitin deacetylase (PgdA/CDA1 family)